METTPQHLAPSRPTRRAHLLFRATVLAVAGVGLYILKESLSGLPKLIVEMARARSFLADAFGVILDFAFAGLGVVCLFAAYRGWFFRTARSVRWICTIASIVLFWFLLAAASLVNEKIPASWHVVKAPVQPRIGIGPFAEVFQLIAAITTMLLYRLAVRWFSTYLNLVDERSHERRLDSVKASIGVVAYLIWMAGSQVGEYLWPMGMSKNGLAFTDQLVAFGPLVLAAPFYRLGVFIATRVARKARQRDLAAREVQLTAMAPADAQASLPVLDYRAPGCAEVLPAEIWPLRRVVAFDRGAPWPVRVVAALACAFLVWFLSYTWGDRDDLAVNVVCVCWAAVLGLVVVGILGTHERKPLLLNKTGL